MRKAFGQKTGIFFFSSLLIACCYWAQADDGQPLDQNAILHVQAGQAWMNVKDYVSAISEFQIALRLKSHSTMAAAVYNDLGIAYEGLDSYPKAIICFQKAIDLNKNFSLYYDNLVRAYKLSGALASADKSLRQTTKLNPNDAQAWYLRAMLALQQGDSATARQALETYLSLAPDGPLAPAAHQHLDAIKQ